MGDSLRQLFERYFTGEEGKPNIGLLIAAGILVCVVLGVMWQTAFGRSASDAGEGQSGGSPPEQAASEEPGLAQEDLPAAGSEDSSADPSGDSGGANLAVVCETFANQEEADLDAAQKDAADKAAGEFVRTVYGYTGTDADAYEASVEEMTVEECFGGSATAEEVAAASEVARQGGEENAPGDRNFLEEYVGFYVNGEERVEGDSGTILAVYGEAVWVSRRAGGEGSTGEEAFNAYQESLTLAKEAGGDGKWKIVEGQGANSYTDGYYADAVDETIQELQDDAGGSTMGATTTEQEDTRQSDGFKETSVGETTATSMETTQSLPTSGE